MHITKAARRYGTALLELAKDRDELEKILEDITLIDNTIADSQDLVVFLQSPVIKFDDKQAVLEELFGEKIQESTRLFLRLLARKKRANMLDQIVRAFITAYNKYAGIIEVEATVAYDLNDDQRASLQSKLEEITGKQVRLSVQKNTTLKGGMAVRIEDTVIDGTVKHKLKELEDQLFSTAIEQ